MTSPLENHPVRDDLFMPEVSISIHSLPINAYGDAMEKYHLMVIMKSTAKWVSNGRELFKALFNQSPKPHNFGRKEMAWYQGNYIHRD